MSVFDRIAVSAPLNATAAKVTGKGTHWTPRKELVKPGDDFSENYLPTKAAPLGTPDLTGQRFGRLRVTGYAGRAHGSKTAKWVVRCDCGSYSHRQGKTLRKPEYASKAMCSVCSYTEEMKAGRVPGKPAWVPT